MYTPALFKVEDMAEAHALMRARPFATLVTNGSEGLAATHLPTVLKTDGAGPLGRIECHVARPNPHWKTFAPDTDALMIFQGPEAYIRPGWYPAKAEHGKVVPTWNYAVVHAYGRLEAVQDPAWLLAHVAELTRQQEAPHDAPWSTSDAPESFLATLARGIVGLSLSTSAAISPSSPCARCLRPSTTPARSRASRFWLILALASRRVMAKLKPTMPRAIAVR